jgi:hypothetical protein
MSDKPESGAAPDKTATFQHRESKLFRVVNVDGAFGGLTPTGKVYAAIYSQLPPIPDAVVQEINEQGQLGAELQRLGGKSIDRILEVGLVMDLNVAKAIRKWLDRKISDLEEAIKQKGE